MTPPLTDEELSAMEGRADQDTTRMLLAEVRRLREEVATARNLAELAAGVVERQAEKLNRWRAVR